MTPNVPGMEAVVSWFGQWPSFHDAEIVSVRIERGSKSSLRIRTWNVSDRLDSSGKFIIEKEAVVVLAFKGVRWLRLEGEDADRQNVIQGVLIDQTPDGYRIQLGPCYGLSGEILTQELSVDLEHLS